MTHKSKTKGNGFERELVADAEAAGLEAVRGWGSDGRTLGEDPEVDLLIAKRKIQAKRRKALASYLIPSDAVDAVIARADAQPGKPKPEAVVVVRWSDWVEMVWRDEQARRQLGEPTAKEIQAKRRLGVQ